MNETNIDEVKKQLNEIIATYKKPIRGKFAVLMPFKKEILTLKARGATAVEITGIMEKCKVKVSKDTVQRFLHAMKPQKRASHSASAPPTGTRTGSKTQ